eukprot:7087256-Alexandrium_andersonii.AAC.1
MRAHTDIIAQSSAGCEAFGSLAMPGVRGREAMGHDRGGHRGAGNHQHLRLSPAVDRRKEGGQ